MKIAFSIIGGVIEIVIKRESDNLLLMANHPVELWGINDCQIFKWNIKSWLHAKGVLASSLAIDTNNSIWCTTKDHKIYRLVGGIDNKYDENNIWEINSKDEVFYRRGNVWIQASGNLSQVSVVADGICWGKC
ncbi:7431_t:CDS:2, partial [Funneliformis caledonium]